MNWNVRVRAFHIQYHIFSLNSAGARRFSAHNNKYEITLTCVCNSCNKIIICRCIPTTMARLGVVGIQGRGRAVYVRTMYVCACMLVYIYIYI